MYINSILKNYLKEIFETGGAIYLELDLNKHTKWPICDTFKAALKNENRKVAWVISFPYFPNFFSKYCTAFIIKAKRKRPHEGLVTNFTPKTKGRHC